jgi:hypothetical protein
MFTTAEIAVLEALHKFTTTVFKKRLIGMHETLNNGVTLATAIKFLFKKRGIEENPTVVVDGLLKYQHIVFVVDAMYPNGRYGLNTLCTCGRHNKYTRREKSAPRVLGKSAEGKVYGYVREIFSGKDLNWSEEVYVADPVTEPKERKVRSKQSKLMKGATNKYAAKAWTQANGSFLAKEKAEQETIKRVLPRLVKRYFQLTGGTK